MNCAICYEDMDMEPYKDPRCSTETCYKLECQHSFHTRCIIEVLTKTQKGCPFCNKTRTLESHMDMRGFAIKTLQKVLRQPEIKQHRKEVKEALNEYKKTNDLLREKVGIYADNLAKEVQFWEKRAYFLDCIKQTKTVVKKHMLKEGANREVSSFFFKQFRHDYPIIEEILFETINKRNRCWTFRWKLLYPRISHVIKNTTKKEKEKYDDSISDSNNFDDVYI
jgi:hypothetical protein